MQGLGFGSLGGSRLGRGSQLASLPALGSNSGRTMGPSKGGFGFGSFDLDMGIEAMLGGARNPW